MKFFTNGEGGYAVNNGDGGLPKTQEGDKKSEWKECSKEEFLKAIKDDPDFASVVESLEDA